MLNLNYITSLHRPVGKNNHTVHHRRYFGICLRHNIRPVMTLVFVQMLGDNSLYRREEMVVFMVEAVPAELPDGHYKPRN